MKTSDVLSKAADLLERDGWCQDRPYNGSAKCALMALNEVRAQANLSLFDGVGGHAYTVLTRAIGSEVAEWNDTPGRTKEEITSTLRACAATERARETKTRERVPA